MTDEAWRLLIPHQGAMQLLDAIVARDAVHIHARTMQHRDPGNPLRRDGRLHAVHLIEIAAQAMAVHGALAARDDGGRARAGWLVGVRDVVLELEYIDGVNAALEVHAECLAVTAAAMLYAFRVESAGQSLARGRATVQLGTED